MTTVVAFAWFPSGEFERAIAIWPDLCESWGGVRIHEEYCRTTEGRLKGYTATGLPVRAVTQIRLDDFLPWCASEGEDPGSGQARATYSAHLLRMGDAIAWPPRRNEPCWCGSRRKYKQCCGPVPAAPLDDDR